MTKSKEVILSDGNELADLVGLSLVSLSVVAVEEISWIHRLCKNEVASRMETICHIMWQVTYPRHYTEVLDQGFFIRSCSRIKLFENYL